MKAKGKRSAGLQWMTLLSVIAWAAFGVAQGSSIHVESAGPGASGEGAADSIGELRQQVQELQAAVAAMRSDWQQARAETAELRRQLDEVRAESGIQDENIEESGTEMAPTSRSGGTGAAAAQAARSSSPARGKGRAKGGQAGGSDGETQPQGNPNPTGEEEQKGTSHGASLEEEYELLSRKVDEQYQTKVESASKYRVRVAGIVLMNLASTQGTVDSVDLPTLAYPRPAGGSGGSFAATLRQSEIGLETFGPTIGGARTRADVQLDFAGGFAPVPNGANSGLVRLRTGTIRMDWANTSLVAGQDEFFVSPNSPTSFASLAVPALSYAGNLWSWTPQVRVEHRVTLGDDSTLLLQGGILDPLSGEIPDTGTYRQGGPGEASRVPAFGSRVAWTRNVFGQPLRVGTGGYYSRQDYGFGRNVDAWAGMMDVELPLGRQFSLGGKLYRGKALGGLYGGTGRSVLFNGDPALADSQVRGLNTVGGWAQLKYRPAGKWEFNAAFGMDNPYARDLKYYPYAQAYGDPAQARNLGAFCNFIYRPRSDLLFSAEYRRLTTYSLRDGGSDAGHLNLMMGVLF
jgi:hypothetical protein